MYTNIVYNIARKEGNDTIIKSNLKPLADAAGLSVLRISKEIDYRYESVRQMYNNTLEHYPRELLQKLCEYLNATPGELLVIEKEPAE